MDEVIKCVINDSTSWVEIVNIIIATINVIAVILFFVFEKRQQKKEKQNDYNLSWYKLIDIPKRTENLNNIITDEIFKLENLKNSDETNLDKRKEKSQKLIVEFDKKIIDEKNIITPIMKCISDENNKKLTTKLNNLIEMHDNKLVNSAILGNNIINYSDFIELKNDIIETYYQIGKIFLK